MEHANHLALGKAHTMIDLRPSALVWSSDRLDQSLMSDREGTVSASPIDQQHLIRGRVHRAQRRKGGRQRLLFVEGGDQDRDAHDNWSSGQRSRSSGRSQSAKVSSK